MSAAPELPRYEIALGFERPMGVRGFLVSVLTAALMTVAAGCGGNEKTYGSSALDCVVTKATEDGYEVSRGTGHEIDPGYAEGASDAVSINPGASNLTATLWETSEDAKRASDRYGSLGGETERNQNVVLFWVSQPSSSLADKYNTCFE